jgi:competence protein ComEC
LPDDTADRDNNLSMVLRITESASDVLFTGDLEAAGERALLARAPIIASTVLKAPHHGSRTSSTAPFITAVRPRLVVLSLGYRNRFHFPDSGVVDRYLAEGARVMRTDEAGAVSVDFGARPLEIKSYNLGRIRLAGD